METEWFPNSDRVSTKLHVHSTHIIWFKRTDVCWFLEVP